MTKELHPRNIHNQNYNFTALSESHPKLKSFVSENKYGDLAINYSDPSAVLTLNQALLSLHYGVKDWSIPKGHLCPPIPGRVDYIHYIADLISDSDGAPPVGTNVKGLDIGSGTGCIYPVLGNSVYGWKFIGSDINSDSINNGKKILDANPKLKKNIKLRFQNNISNIFKNIIKSNEKFDFSMCNPPFHSSPSQAKKSSARKVTNLNINKDKKGHTANKIIPGQASNFGGKDYELWCPGGELAFIKTMITESVAVKEQCSWFTTLVSNNKNLSELSEYIESYDCHNIRIIKMHHGKKTVHILAWQF